MHECVTFNDKHHRAPCTSGNTGVLDTLHLMSWIRAPHELDNTDYAYVAGKVPDGLLRKIHFHSPP
jgi:hypothetical protein